MVHLSQGDIVRRARTDLSERCFHWLRTTLKYLLPPARVLEVGSGHGGFVALLRWAGFDATGLELSPWVVEYSRSTFDIPVLLGPVEDHAIESGSLAAVVLMDVLEHLPDPISTMRRCAELLSPDGIFIVQTPRVPAGSCAELEARNDRFLELLQPDEHLFLFTDESVRRLFRGIGISNVVSEPAIFAFYDMFVVASRGELHVQEPDAIRSALEATASGRLVQALRDLDEQLQANLGTMAELNADREARLGVITAQGHELGRAVAERNVLSAQLEDLRSQFEGSEADRAARLEIIERQGAELGQLAAEREELEKRVKELESRRGALTANPSVRENSLVQRITTKIRAVLQKTHGRD